MQAKRVLLYRMGSLGDHLVALPSYRLIARAFPQAERRLLTTVPVASVAATAQEVLAGMGLVDGYLTYASHERSPLALLQLAWQVRRYKPDVVIHMTGPLKNYARDERFFRLLCGVRRQIGLPSEPTDALQTVGFRDGVPYYEQEGQRLARVLGRELGDARVDELASWSLDLTAEEHAEAARLTAPLGSMPYFVFSMGTKIQANEWGLERWQRFLAALGREWPGYAMVAIGAKDEFKKNQALVAAWGESGNPVLNLSGVCTPRVSAAVLAKAKMFFGHDSGPMHLAASVDTPIFAVFSARNRPGEWTPRGEHVRTMLHWVECGHCVLDACLVEKKKCILSISVEEALAAARQHLDAVLKREPLH